MPWYKIFFEQWYLEFWPSRLQKFKPAYIKKEAAFIKRTLRLPEGAKILDCCCGHGRHTIPLAKMGYTMTGLDLSEKALTLLRKKAKATRVRIRLLRSDMRKIPWTNEFDAVINMFTAFGYLENDREDFKVLKGIAAALKPDGKFLIDIANIQWMLGHFIPRSWHRTNGMLMLEDRKYNPQTRRHTTHLYILDKKGKWHHQLHRIRMYSLPEMKKLLAKVGLKVVRIFGDTVGIVPFSKDTKRLVILAVKKK